ncbi:hypothetical protein M6B38_328125 [Iris pallida]|uniref:Uncharacterized protein n=1 Tax=Iris pallida TaxID=29817 RepID=A0AAX6H709_IRIPA|nr:hypothetical protein M6B38_224050 [Iris pallida]KAJ6836351.1 hypothetical protein M6B38_328125 [Iris pallida]
MCHILISDTRYTRLSYTLFIACESLFITGIGKNISFCVTTPNIGIVDSLIVHFTYDEAGSCRID